MLQHQGLQPGQLAEETKVSWRILARDEASDLRRELRESREDGITAFPRALLPDVRRAGLGENALDVRRPVADLQNQRVVDIPAPQGPSLTFRYNT